MFNDNIKNKCKLFIFLINYSAIVVIHHATNHLIDALIARLKTRRFEQAEGTVISRYDLPLLWRSMIAVKYVLHIAVDPTVDDLNRSVYSHDITLNGRSYGIVTIKRQFTTLVGRITDAF